MEMFNPSHPGKILKDVYLPDYNLSVSAFALKIGVSRNTASEIINGRSGISAEMALKLEKAFKVSAKFWLDLQTQYDLWQAKQRVNLDNVEVIAL
jgi:addiction module HigA family antidote